MTETEALSVLRDLDCDGYIAWDEDRNAPDTRSGYVRLDGAFSEQQLRAILVFFEKISTL
jgi:hypothetical protein